MATINPRVIQTKRKFYVLLKNTTTRNNLIPSKQMWAIDFTRAHECNVLSNAAAWQKKWKLRCKPNLGQSGSDGFTFKSC